MELMGAVFRLIREIVKVNQLTEESIGCPYCGETIEILIDSSDAQQQYIEDCKCVVSR